jgi:hypothetical protein
VRPGEFELPTFWFVGGNYAPRRTTAADNTQRNQRKTRTHFGWRRLVLYPVHGHSHRQFGPQAAAGENDTGAASMMVNFTTMPAYLLGGDQETTTCLDLDMHRNLRRCSRAISAARPFLFC